MRKQRKSQPLLPDRQVWYVDGSRLVQLDPQSLSSAEIGLKAWGLLSIPAEWTVPFCVVNGTKVPTEMAVKEAIERLGIDQGGLVLVRSSGTHEGMAERGSLQTEQCSVAELTATLKRLIENRSREPVVHWIVQGLIVVRVKGHLSNERRLCKDVRDWEVEFEPSRGQPHENERIALRTWRDDQPSDAGALKCAYRANCSETLETVAKWGYERLLRLHFEWVWDGSNIFVVQADEYRGAERGVTPQSLVQVPTGNIDVGALAIFRVATTQDRAKYRKLSNVAIYERLGYETVPFYVLDDKKTLADLISKSILSPALEQDLKVLVKRPLVIRTNGKGEMLPRSDELRNIAEAQNWLTDSDSREAWANVQKTEELCLIAHSFVPGTASAWCLAHPDKRRVRIESLWGIPEGLYWYAHDVFDVDTGVKTVDISQSAPDSLDVRERPRYKGVFVAPNSEGHWVLHNTTTGYDWRPSIRESRWVNTIAWDSRRIAQTVGHSVVVMWLVDVPPQISKHAVMPWYHQAWESDDATATAAPRKKHPGAAEFVIRTRGDWDELRSRSASSPSIARVIVDPRDTELIRNKDFAEALGNLAKERGFVVELAGGMLSHAYYTLARTGCSVECADLYATDEEEIEFNKLVRDQIPMGIEARGESVEIVKLEGEALIDALKRKLIEESFETADASNVPQITDELADLYEVAATLASRLGIKDADIQAARLKKAQKRGRFKDGVMLVRTSLEPSIRTSPNARQDAKSADGQPMLSISRAEELPLESRKINVDHRRNAAGFYEVQVTFTAPVYLQGAIPGKPNLALEAPDGSPHKMTLELTLDRQGSEIRWTFHLRNPPDQLDLPLKQKGEKSS